MATPPLSLTSTGARGLYPIRHASRFMLVVCLLEIRVFVRFCNMEDVAQRSRYPHWVIPLLIGQYYISDHRFPYFGMCSLMTTKNQHLSFYAPHHMIYYSTNNDLCI